MYAAENKSDSEINGFVERGERSSIVEIRSDRYYFKLDAINIFLFYYFFSSCGSFNGPMVHYTRMRTGI